MKKIGLLSITEWSQSRRLSVCINNKSQRRHASWERSGCPQLLGRRRVKCGQQNFTAQCGPVPILIFIPTLQSPRPLEPSHKGLGEISPFRIGTSLSSEFARSLFNIYLLVIGVTIKPGVYEPQYDCTSKYDQELLTHCRHLGDFWGRLQKDYPSFHPPSVPASPSPMGSWGCAGAYPSCKWPKVAVKDGDRQWLKCS